MRNQRRIFAESDAIIAAREMFPEDELDQLFMDQFPRREPPPALIEQIIASTAEIARAQTPITPEPSLPNGFLQSPFKWDALKPRRSC